jgi:hypothetical protein
MTVRGFLAVALVLAAAADGALAETQLLVSSGFEEGQEGWSQLWTREEAAGEETLDYRTVHTGGAAARVTHRGERDWAKDRAEALAVQPGDLLQLTAWTRVTGAGTVALCVTLRDPQGGVLAWTYAASTARGDTDWRELRSRFVVPPGAASLRPRLVGSGAATVWIDDVSLVREGCIDMPKGNGAGELTCRNRFLDVRLSTQDATLHVHDVRTGRTWSQRPTGPGLLVTRAEQREDGFDIRLIAAETAAAVDAVVTLAAGAPEVAIELAGEGEMAGHTAFPHPFTTRPKDLLIMPVNEGISYPVGDGTIPETEYILYGGHGLCMPWYGVTPGAGGVMVIVETPDDATVALRRVDGLLAQQPIWQPQLGRFGPRRRMRYVFLADGGYVAMAKRYRRHAHQTGLLRTLAEKRDARPAVDMLVGAVNIWCWNPDAPAICRTLRRLGIERILWSECRDPAALRALNEMGVLTSRYDIYQDVMDPGNFPHLSGVHPDWPTEAWPADCMTDERGRLREGWRVQGKDGTWYACNVLCDRVAPGYARERIRRELETHPYRCRFIDTTTASPWRECYHADHPMSRSESRRWRMALLRLVSEEFGLVCGSETGHDAAVPHVDYFEGMLSLGPYRVPDAGRRIQELWHEVPEPVARFQTGHYYRLPLWELVYHDCVVAHWYWGDYSNKLPPLWDRRDLFNALYATAPMFMFDRQGWDEHSDRFVRSYRETCPIARACGYSEMLEHRWLTDDHSVQQTSFSNGVTVTVNFGDRPHRMSDGHVLDPVSKRVEGVPDAGSK